MEKDNKSFLIGLAVLLVLIFFFYFIFDISSQEKERLIITGINSSFLTLKIYPLLIASGILVGLFFIIFFSNLSQLVNKLTIYHKLEDTMDQQNPIYGELFKEKCWKVFSCNLKLALSLSIVIILALYPYFGTNNPEYLKNSSLTTFDIALITIIIIIPGLLFALRILSNPTKTQNTFLLRTIRCDIKEIDDLLRICSQEIIIKNIHSVKERISSFYFSLIASSIVILFIIIYYNLLMFVFSPQKVYLISSVMPFSAIIAIFIAEVIAILMLSLLGELYLKLLGPIDQI